MPGPLNGLVENEPPALEGFLKKSMRSNRMIILDQIAYGMILA